MLQQAGPPTSQPIPSHLRPQAPPLPRRPARCSRQNPSEGLPPEPRTGPHRPAPRPHLLRRPCGSCLPRGGAEGAQRPPQVRSKKRHPHLRDEGLNSEVQTEPFHSTVSMVTRGSPFQDPRRTLLFGPALQTLRSWTVPVPACQFGPVATWRTHELEYEIDLQRVKRENNERKWKHELIRIT